MSQPFSGATDLAPDLRPDDLRVTRIRALRGPNYWRLAPVIACDVALGGLEHVTSADLPDFIERLTRLLPSLHEHECSRGVAGGFLERLREGTHLPHILEHVALELQVLAGSDAAASGEGVAELIAEAHDMAQSGDEEGCMEKVTEAKEALGIN